MRDFSVRSSSNVLIVAAAVIMAKNPVQGVQSGLVSQAQEHQFESGSPNGFLRASE